MHNFVIYNVPAGNNLARSSSPGSSCVAVQGTLTEDADIPLHPEVLPKLLNGSHIRWLISLSQASSHQRLLCPSPISRYPFLDAIRRASSWILNITDMQLFPSFSPPNMRLRLKMLLFPSKYGR
jgi:hypothetical protein